MADGIRIGLPHFGHRPVFLVFVSDVVNRFWHLGQMTRIIRHPLCYQVPDAVGAPAQGCVAAPLCPKRDLRRL